METMIQPKVTGYRQLSEAEVALMNEGKALAEQCGAYIAKLRGYVPQNMSGPEGGEAEAFKPGATRSTLMELASPELFDTLFETTFSDKIVVKKINTRFLK